MKKLRYIIVLFISLIMLVGCTNSNTPVKTEFTKNEQASIDNLDIKLSNIKKENDILELIFQITNNRKNTITLVPDTNFVMYDINKVQIPNIYSNDSNIIKSKTTKSYTLQYNVTDKGLYEVLFYSGIVENNIKFTITSSDIEKK